MADKQSIWGIYYNYRDQDNRDSYDLLEDEFFWDKKDADARCLELNKHFIERIVSEHKKKETAAFVRKQNAYSSYGRKLREHEESKVLVEAGLRDEIVPHPGAEPVEPVMVETEPVIDLPKQLNEYYEVDEIEVT